ncbi:MAG: hypothetical protein RMK18_04130 [Armatimonadota bacterium]|nr:hypothetical protein [Armatimonadota bacterium]MCX7777210.1 hypothetical protein [Armatimonadota bacterium]MDW8025037.1 hypothetical protein [Armatimonadota bacterium]
MLKTEDGRKWVSLEEAQNEFGVTYATLHRLYRSGSIDSLKLHQRAILLDYDQLKFWHERFYRKTAAEKVRHMWQKRREELVAKIKAAKGKGRRRR